MKMRPENYARLVAPRIKILSVRLHPNVLIAVENIDKNSSADEIANVYFLTTMSHTYFKISKKNLLRLTN